ncbi:Uncharacterised protein [Salmonella bongori]|nr:Uncharacterised protein [Salmonella bongori]
MVRCTLMSGRCLYVIAEELGISRTQFDQFPAHDAGRGRSSVAVISSSQAAAGSRRNAAQRWKMPVMCWGSKPPTMPPPLNALIAS